MDWPSATLSAQRAASRHAAAGFDRSMRRLEEADLAFEANRDPYARPMPAYGQPRDAPSYRQQGAAQPNRDYDDASIRGRGLGGYPAVPPPPPMQMQMDYRPALMDQYSDHRPAQQPAAPLAFQQQEQHALYPDAAKLEAVSQELRQILNGVSSAARDVQQQLDLLTSAHGALESRMRGLDDDVVPRVERLGRLAARRAEEVLEVVQNARRAFTERASADDATHATTRASISALRAALEDRPTRRGAIELATDAARRWCESEPAASAWVRREALDAIVETLRRPRGVFAELEDRVSRVASEVSARDAMMERERHEAWLDGAHASLASSANEMVRAATEQVRAASGSVLESCAAHYEKARDALRADAQAASTAADEAARLSAGERAAAADERAAAERARAATEGERAAAEGARAEAERLLREATACMRAAQERFDREPPTAPPAPAPAADNALAAAAADALRDELRRGLDAEAARGAALGDRVAHLEQRLADVEQLRETDAAEAGRRIGLAELSAKAAMDDAATVKAAMDEAATAGAAHLDEMAANDRRVDDFERRLEEAEAQIVDAMQQIFELTDAADGDRVLAANRALATDNALAAAQHAAEQRLEQSAPQPPQTTAEASQRQPEAAPRRSEEAAPRHAVEPDDDDDDDYDDDDEDDAQQPAEPSAWHLPLATSRQPSPEPNLSLEPRQPPAEPGSAAPQLVLETSNRTTPPADPLDSTAAAVKVPTPPPPRAPAPLGPPPQRPERSRSESPQRPSDGAAAPHEAEEPRAGAADVAPGRVSAPGVAAMEAAPERPPSGPDDDDSERTTEFAADSGAPADSQGLQPADEEDAVVDFEADDADDEATVRSRARESALALVQGTPDDDDEQGDAVVPAAEARAPPGASDVAADGHEGEDDNSFDDEASDARAESPSPADDEDGGGGGGPDARGAAEPAEASLSDFETYDSHFEAATSVRAQAMIDVSRRSPFTESSPPPSRRTLDHGARAPPPAQPPQSPPAPGRRLEPPPEPAADSDGDEGAGLDFGRRVAPGGDGDVSAQCQYCMRRVPRKDMAAHVADECKLAVMPCPRGCGERVRRWNLAQHQKTGCRLKPHSPQESRAAGRAALPGMPHPATPVRRDDDDDDDVPVEAPRGGLLSGLRARRISPPKAAAGDAFFPVQRRRDAPPADAPAAPRAAPRAAPPPRRDGRASPPPSDARNFDGPAIDSDDACQALDWRPEETCAYVSDVLGLPSVGATFARHRIGGALLVDMTSQDLLAPEPRGLGLTPPEADAVLMLIKNVQKRANRGGRATSL